MSQAEVYRKFYEDLSQARESLREKRQKELDSNALPPPFSIIFKRGFKNRLLDAVIHAIGENGSARVLDIGCGYGEDIIYLMRGARFSCFAADISLNQLALLRKEIYGLGESNFIQACAERLPFKEGIFDIVVFSEVIEHLPDPEAALNEIRVSLKPGGHLFISTPNKYAYFHFVGRLFPKKIRHWLLRQIKSLAWDVDLTDDRLTKGMVEHISLFSIFSLKRALKRSGLKVERLISSNLDVPLPDLFDRYPLLLRLWAFLDRAIDPFFFGKHIKSHIVIVARR